MAFINVAKHGGSTSRTRGIGIRLTGRKGQGLAEQTLEKWIGSEAQLSPDLG
jgi:hypothetical protein